MKLKLGKLQKKVLMVTLLAFGLFSGLNAFVSAPAYCTTDTSTILTEWLPTILELMIFSLMIGILTKMMSKFGSGK